MLKARADDAERRAARALANIGFPRAAPDESAPQCDSSEVELNSSTKNVIVAEPSTVTPFNDVAEACRRRGRCPWALARLSAAVRPPETTTGRERPAARPPRAGDSACDCQRTPTVSRQRMVFSPYLKLACAIAKW